METSDEEEEKTYLSVKEQTRKELEQPPKRADGAQDGRGPVLVGVHSDHVDQARRARRRDAEAHVQLSKSAQVFNRRAVGSACRQGSRRVCDVEKRETYGESDVEAGEDVEDVEEKGVLLGKAVVDRSEPQDEAANGPSRLSLPAVSPVDEGRGGGGERLTQAQK